MKRWWRERVWRQWRMWTLLVVLGVVTNVLVVVWIEWRGGWATGVRSYLFDYGSGIWMVSRHESPGVWSEQWFARQVVFPDTSRAERKRLVEMYRENTRLMWEPGRPAVRGPMAWLAARPMTSSTSMRYQRLVGWPWKALASTWRPRTAVSSPETEGELALTSPTARGVKVPLIPVWPGFVLNSLVYGAAWALVVGLALVPRRVRRVVRVRGGRCPSCGYDLVGKFAEGCSECGWGRESEKRKTKSEN